MMQLTVEESIHISRKINKYATTHVTLSIVFIMSSLWVTPPNSPRDDPPLDLYPLHIAFLEGHSKPVQLLGQNLNFVFSCSVNECFVWFKQDWRLLHKIPTPRVRRLAATEKLLILRDDEFFVSVWDPVVGKQLYKRAVASKEAPMDVSQRMNLLVAAHNSDVMELFRVTPHHLEWVCLLENDNHKGAIRELSCAGSSTVTFVEHQGFFIWCIDPDSYRFTDCLAKFEPRFDARAGSLLSLTIAEEKAGVLAATFSNGELHSYKWYIGGLDRLVIDKREKSLRDMEIFGEERVERQVFFVGNDENFELVGGGQVCMSSDGDIAVAGFDWLGVVTLDVETGKMMHMLKSDNRNYEATTVYRKVGSRGGYQIVTANRENELWVWDLNWGSQIKLGFLLTFHPRCGENTATQRMLITNKLFKKSVRKRMLSRIFSMTLGYDSRSSEEMDGNSMRGYDTRAAGAAENLEEPVVEEHEPEYKITFVRRHKLPRPVTHPSPELNVNWDEDTASRKIKGVTLVNLDDPTAFKRKVGKAGNFKTSKKVFSKH